MRVDHKLLILGITFVGAISALITGCGSRQDDPAALRPTTTVGTETDHTVITTKVKSALLTDPDIKSFDLKVETRKGLVQLSGFVDNQAQIDRAITAARGVEGAKDVE